MAQIIVQDLGSRLIARLKSQARRHSRHLEVTARYSMEEARQVAEQWRQRLAGQMLTDSADLIRGDRER